MGTTTNKWSKLNKRVNTTNHAIGGIISGFKQIGEGVQNKVAPVNEYGYSTAGTGSQVVGGLFNPMEGNKSALRDFKKGDVGIKTFAKLIPGLGSVLASKDGAKDTKEAEAEAYKQSITEAKRNAPVSSGGINLADTISANGGYITTAMLQKAKGGYTGDGDPVKNKRAQPMGINKLKTSDLEAHKANLRDLSKVYDPKKLGANSQYTLMSLPSQKYMSKIRETGNINTYDETGKRAWDKKSNEIMGYISSTGEYTDKDTDFIKNPEALKNKIPFTEMEFAANPNLYKHSLDGQTYDDYYKYIHGTNTPVQAPKAALTNRDALEDVASQMGTVVSKAHGGYMNPLSTPTNGLVNYRGGGTHAQNPLGGIPLGRNQQGKQNAVENKESSMVFPEGKYIFSNRLKLKK